MMMIVLVLMLVLGAALGAYFWIRSHGRREIPKTTSDVSRYAMNVGAVDASLQLLTGAKLDTLLDEIAASGYQRVIRLPFGEDWGESILGAWSASIRSRGFKILPILAHGAHELTLDVARTETWIRQALPVMRDLLVGVQIVNEQWIAAGRNNHRFEPIPFVAWHNRLAAVVREVTPNVPIVVGDFFTTARNEHSVEYDGFAWWQQVVAAGISHVDVISLHVYEADEGRALDQYRLILTTFGAAAEYWITECDRVGHLDVGLRAGLHIPRCFLYSWNNPDGFALRPDGPIP